MDVWKDGCIGRWKMTGWMDGRMDAWMDRWVDGCMNQRVGRWVGGSLDGYMGRGGGWVDR